jgi:hypothetical protein
MQTTNFKTYWLVNRHITSHTVFVLVRAEWVMRRPAIDSPDSCEIRNVIRFLHAIKMSCGNPSLIMLYAGNIMTKRTVREWCRMFEHWRANKCSWRRAKWSAGRPSVVSDILVENVEQNICELRRFTISEPSFQFPLSPLRDYRS